MMMMMMMIMLPASKHFPALCTCIKFIYQIKLQLPLVLEDFVSNWTCTCMLCGSHVVHSYVCLDVKKYYLL